MFFVNLFGDHLHLKEQSKIKKNHVVHRCLKKALSHIFVGGSCDKKQNSAKKESTFKSRDTLQSPHYWRILTTFKSLWHNLIKKVSLILFWFCYLLILSLFIYRVLYPHSTDMTFMATSCLMWAIWDQVQLKCLKGHWKKEIRISFLIFSSSRKSSSVKDGD